MGAGLSSYLPYASATALGMSSAWYLINKQPKARKHTAACDDDKGKLEAAEFTVLRKAMLVEAKPSDHSGEVVVTPDPKFDLNKTIFKTVEGALPRYIMEGKTGVDMFWCDAAANKYNAAAVMLPPTVPHDKALINFMLNDCDFFMEHADGSFMDHLQFCYDYSTHYFKGHSPRVLLLHSIMGVATNIFPMDVSKEPKLRSMLTDDEMVHVEAFPSVLRCLLNWDLTNDLTSTDTSKLKSLKTFTYHRCIDNEKQSMTIEQFWVHLNYQLIHLLDFLPASSWESHMNDQLFQVFIKLYEFLVYHNKLMAKVDLDLSEAQSDLGAQPLTLSDMIRRSTPNFLMKKLHLKSIRKFSANIGHNLEYTLV